MPLRCFSAKKHSLQDSCIDHLLCLWKFVFTVNLAGFSKLNDFTINLFTQEVALITFFSQELTFSRNSAERSDFRGLEWIPLRCFSAKTRQFPRF